MRKKGSAILTVIGAISVLVILVVAFISASREKAGLSNLMTDEKKLEAIAESANDYILKFIKTNANINEDSTDANSKYLESIYYLLRAPLIAEGSTNEQNFKLKVSDVQPVEIDNSLFNYMQVIEPSIREIGWEGRVEVKATCELCSAECFTPYTFGDNGYKVTTIDYEHFPAEGNSAKFLDNDQDPNNGIDNSSDDWSSSQWNLRLKFPKGNPTYEEKEATIEIHPLILPNFDEDITLKVSRSSEESNTLHIKIDDISIIGSKDFGDMDIQDKMDHANFFPDIQEKTLPGLKRAYSIGTPNYDFSGYVSKIRNRKSTVNNNFKAIVNGFDIDNSNFTNPYYLEKGAILRIKTNVKFKRSESDVLEKTLVTEIPFKASDVQPIAPEYSFFIANSKKVSPQSDIVCAAGEPYHELGTPIEINKSDSSEYYNGNPPSGELIVHNVPNTSGKVDYTKLGDERIPGMVRINSNYTPGSGQVTKARSFLGLISRPELTELNKFFTPFNNASNNYSANNFNTRISFAWEDTPFQRYHELEFPLLFEDAKHETLQPGIDNVVNVFKQAGYLIISIPTLLFGTCHIEYPLGLRVEGPIDSIYSRTRIKVEIKGEVGEFYYDDNTVISYDYEPLSTYSDGSVYGFHDDADTINANLHATYGMPKYPGYKPEDNWKCNEDYKYSPANCYDALQYAKKATKYYDTASDFLADMDKDITSGGLNNNGVIELNGVFYIKDGTLDFKAGQPIEYKGNGIIVSKKKDININSNITRADTTSTLGIIARGGRIKFNTALVEAACFSNNTPTCTVSDFSLNGNMVCNNFLRDKFIDAHIYYDNTMCTVTPLASLRKIGKFEPRRYIVTFADNLSRFSFVKGTEE